MTYDVFNSAALVDPHLINSRRPPTTRSFSEAVQFCSTMMKLLSVVALAASASAFAPANTGGPSSTQLRVEIGSTGVEFENVAREWRCE